MRPPRLDAHAAGVCVLVALALLGSGGAASRPGGVWLGLPSSTSTGRDPPDWRSDPLGALPLSRRAASPKIFIRQILR
jgi:hypothetical protein